MSTMTKILSLVVLSLLLPVTVSPPAAEAINPHTNCRNTSAPIDWDTGVGGFPSGLLSHAKTAANWWEGYRNHHNGSPIIPVSEVGYGSGIRISWEPLYDTWGFGLCSEDRAVINSREKRTFETDTASFRALVAHELGHVLGTHHVGGDHDTFDGSMGVDAPRPPVATTGLLGALREDGGAAPEPVTDVELDGAPNDPVVVTEDGLVQFPLDAGTPVEQLAVPLVDNELLVENIPDGVTFVAVQFSDIGLAGPFGVVDNEAVITAAVPDVADIDLHVLLWTTPVPDYGDGMTRVSVLDPVAWAPAEQRLRIDMAPALGPIVTPLSVEAFEDLILARLEAGA